MNVLKFFKKERVILKNEKIINDFFKNVSQKWYSITIVITQSEWRMSMNNKKSKFISLRIKGSDIEIIRKAKEYCKERGIIFGKFIVDALDYYMNKDRDPILKEMEFLRNEVEFLRNEIFDMKNFLKSSRITFEEKKITIEKEENLPSFLKDNPWVRILSKKGRERRIWIRK